MNSPPPPGKDHALEATASESPPRLHESLAFLPAWKRGVYALAAGASLLGGYGLFTLAALGAPRSLLLLAGVVLGAGGLAARVAWRGTVAISRPGWVETLGLGAIALLAAFALLQGLWLGAAALLFCVVAGRVDLRRLERSYREEEEEPTAGSS